MLNLDKLEQEIAQQTRNGRQSVYVKISDLKELGDTCQTTSDSDRIFVDLDKLESLLSNYKVRHTSENKAKSFRDSLKISDITTTKSTTIRVVEKDSLDLDR